MAYQSLPSLMLILLLIPPIHRLPPLPPLLTVTPRLLSAIVNFVPKIVTRCRGYWITTNKSITSGTKISGTGVERVTISFQLGPTSIYIGDLLRNLEESVQDIVRTDMNKVDNDICCVYKNAEISSCVPPDYMIKQFDINVKMRVILIDWLIEQYYEIRLAYLAGNNEMGENPYLHKFEAVYSVPKYLGEYESLESGALLEDVEASLAGRIMSKLSSSSKLFFYDLHCGGAKVQVMAAARKSELSEEEFSKFHSGVKRGDIVGIKGFPGKSKGGGA